jgi:hypothetical protein
MRRLYLQIYVASLGILLLFGVLVTVASLLIPMHPREHLLFDGMGAVLSELLPGPERLVPELQAAVEHLRRLLPIDLAVYSADGALLAAVGPPLQAPPPQHMPPGWMHARGAGPTVALPLPDGRSVVARWQRSHRPLGLLGALGLLALAMALGAYPVVRRITRRLERLQTQVAALGAGDLTVCVRSKGRMRWRSWRAASTVRRIALRAWSTPSAPCSPAPRTRYAHLLPACGWLSSSYHTTGDPNSRYASRRISRNSTP